MARMVRKGETYISWVSNKLLDTSVIRQTDIRRHSRQTVYETNKQKVNHRRQNVC